MLPEYNAVSFVRIIEKGGHSKPWVVVCQTENSLKTFVVKIYATADIEARNKVTAEVIGSVLATEFDFATPKPALITFTDDFTMQLNANCALILNTKDDRIKFGTELIEGTFLFDYETNKKNIERLINPASLFAFDYFICNRDRNHNKPNMLVKGNDCYLIDHEMALEITTNTLNDLKNFRFDKRYENHIFYAHLKSKPAQWKEECFNEFEIYLHELSLNKLNSYFCLLEDHNYETRQNDVLNYFNAIKQSPSKFFSILKTAIR